MLYSPDGGVLSNVVDPYKPDLEGPFCYPSLLIPFYAVEGDDCAVSSGGADEW